MENILPFYDLDKETMAMRNETFTVPQYVNKKKPDHLE